MECSCFYCMMNNYACSSSKHINLYHCMFMGLVSQVDSIIGSVLFVGRRVGYVTVTFDEESAYNKSRKRLAKEPVETKVPKIHDTTMNEAIP